MKQLDVKSFWTEQVESRVFQDPLLALLAANVEGVTIIDGTPYLAARLPVTNPDWMERISTTLRASPCWSALGKDELTSVLSTEADWFFLPLREQQQIISARIGDRMQNADSMVFQEDARTVIALHKQCGGISRFYCKLAPTNPCYAAMRSNGEISPMGNWKNRELLPIGFMSTGEVVLFLRWNDTSSKP